LGQPFFPRPASGDSVGLADGVSVADGDSPGVGVGDAFLRFDLLLGVGDGVGEAFFDFGEAVGVGVDVAFFFRCLRDELGVGSGSKAFLIFVPNDSRAGYAGGTAPNAITTAKNPLSAVLNAIGFCRAFL